MKRRKNDPATSSGNHSHSPEIKKNRFVFSLVLTGLIFLVEFIGGGQPGLAF